MFYLGPGGRKYNTYVLFAPKVMFQRAEHLFANTNGHSLNTSAIRMFFSTLRYTAVVGKIEIEAFSC